jgi:hypothetical protein
MNGDGKQDLIVTDITANAVDVLLGEGDGTFEPAKKSPAGSEPFALVTADFNGDDNLDAAVVDLSGSVSVLLGKGDGTFRSTKIAYDGGPVPFAIAVGDFNGDQKSDLDLPL